MRTEGLGLVGFTQVEFGLVKRWVLDSWSFWGDSDRVVVDNGFWGGDCSGSDEFEGDFNELQKLFVNLFVGYFIVEVKQIVCFLSEFCMLQ